MKVLFLIPDGYLPAARRNFIYLVVKLAQECSKLEVETVVAGLREVTYFGRHVLHNSLGIHRLNDLLNSFVDARPLGFVTPRIDDVLYSEILAKLGIDAVFIPQLGHAPIGLYRASARAGVPLLVWDSEGHPSLFESKWKEFYGQPNVILLTMNLGIIPFIKEQTKNTKVFHFPYFCDPETFYPLRNRVEEYDISYTGNYKQYGVPRLGQVDGGPTTKETGFKMTVDPLAQVYKERLHLFGAGYPRQGPLAKCSTEGVISWEQTNIVNNRSRVCLSIHSDDYRSSSLALNPRFFSILSSQGFMLTDHVKDVETWFETGKDFVVTESAKETLELVDYYMHSPLERETVSRNGRRAVLRSHTAHHRAQLLRELMMKYC